MFYLNTFFFYSIIGHIMENIVYTKVDSGILYGYWTPIYGLGCLLIMGIDYVIKKYINNKWLRVIMLFISCSLIIGCLELFGGIFIEKIFGRIFWDYSNDVTNIFRYTSLKMMLLWGTLGVILIYVINPIVKKFLEKVPKVITIILCCLFVFDLVYTLINLGN